MDENDIEMMVNLSGGNQSEQDFGYSLKMAEMMQGRVINCYTPDWYRIDEPDFGLVEALRLKNAVQRGFKCLKIAKILGLYLRYDSKLLVSVDDPVLDPLWESAGELDIPVYMHIGDPRAFFEPPTPENERYAELGVHPAWSFFGQDFPSFHALLDAFERVVASHPETTFIGVHFGNDAEEPEFVAEMLDRYPNYYIDIAARVPEFGRHPAKQMHDFFVKYQDRILFGTDTGISPRHIMLGSTGRDEPTTEDAKRFFAAHFRYFESNDVGIDHPTPIQGDWKVDAIGLPAKVLDKLYRENAIRLLKLVPPQP